MKKVLICVLLIVLVVSVGFVSAKKEKGFKLPKNAVEVSKGVFYLGKTGNVEGYAFLKYKKGRAKPGTDCGNGICDPGENAKKCPSDCGGSVPEPVSDCYAFLAKGAKWKTIEPYYINPLNQEGLDHSSVVDSFSNDISKWEMVANRDILGEGTTTMDTLEADTISPDNKNEVYFGDILEENVIGVTIVWGIFSAPPSKRQLVEWDQVYDEVDFDWSLEGNALKMDFSNIAIHELGHSLGLADLYDGACSEQTMYGYATEGETKKRTLEAGDITGIRSLYK